MKALIGKVISTKQEKTAVVEVERFFRHPIYEKRIRRTKKYQVHAEGEVKVGDRVRFVETQPISKTKRWRLLEK